MRLTRSSRILAATGLALVSVFCASIVGIWLAADLSLSELVASDSPLRATTIFLVGTCIIALMLAILLFSSLPVSKTQRLWLLAAVIGITLLSLGFAQLVFVPLLLPLWKAWSFFREAT